MESRLIVLVELLSQYSLGVFAMMRAGALPGDLVRINIEGGKVHSWLEWETGDIGLPNVPDDLPPLAFGIRACPAGEMPKVPKAWWLGPSAR